MTMCFRAAATADFVIGPVRRDDQVLCQGVPTDDLAEMVKDLAAQGGKPLESVEDPSRLGKTYIVPRAPARFLAPSVWGPKQAAVRAQLPELMDRWLARR